MQSKMRFSLNNHFWYSAGLLGTISQAEKKKFSSGNILTYGVT